MRRRDFLALVGGAAVVRSFPAGAQERQAVRRIGVLLTAARNDPEFEVWLAAFVRRLAELGWTLGRNLDIDTRWCADSAETRKQAADLVAKAPDLILAHGASAVGPVLQVTRSVPVVFPVIADPVAAGFVDDLAHPGGSATGFMLFEYSISGKWLELLKQMAPSVRRVGVIGDPSTPTGPAQFGIIQSLAPSLGLQITSINKGSPDAIESAIAAFAHDSGGGLIVTAGGPALFHRELIIRLTARYKLPAVYFDRSFVVHGGLSSYGPDRIDLYERAAGYADRILKGEKPGDLPVQSPNKYQLSINLKTAKTLGLSLPQSLLLTADEVIE